MRGSNLSLLVFSCMSGGNTDFCERDLLAQENEWRSFVVIECSESAVCSRKISVEIRLTGSQQIRYLTFSAESCCTSGLGDHHRCRRGQSGNNLPELQLLKRR